MAQTKFLIKHSTFSSSHIVQFNNVLKDIIFHKDIVSCETNLLSNETVLITTGWWADFLDAKYLIFRINQSLKGSSIKLISLEII